MSKPFTWTSAGLLVGYTYTVSAHDGIVHVYTSDGVHVSSYKNGKRIVVATESETNAMLERVLKNKDQRK